MELPRGPTIASIEYVLGAAFRGCPTDKWPPTSPSSAAPRAASSRRSGSGTSNNAKTCCAGPRALVRPVAAAAQAQSAAARKGLGAGRRADPGDHRDRAPRRGQVVGRSPPGRAGRARRHAPLLAGLGHHAAASARRRHRCASVFDFGNACVCCAPDGDLQALLKKKKSARSVVIETTGTADPALFARVLHQDAKLRELYVLRSVVFVGDARDVRKQLAAPDSPGAPNPHRLQLLAANHAVLTRGGDVTLTGFAGPVDQGLPGRDALEGFDAAAVVKRRPDFFGVDPTRPCRFVRPVVSFAPSDGVLRAVAVVEQGAAREADVLAFAEDLDASSAVARFRIAADGASTGALLVDGGRGGEALRVVRLDDGVAPDDDASTASSEAADVDAGDWRREVAPQLRLFVLGTKLDAASLREGLRACLVPEGFRYAADEELDFGVCSDDDPLSRCLAGAPAEARDRVCTTLDGTSIEILRRPDGSFAATDAAGASREVVRLFDSAIYVK